MEIKVELNIPADLEIELSSTFLVEPSRQFGVEHSYTEFLELSNCSRVFPLYCEDNLHTNGTILYYT